MVDYNDVDVYQQEPGDLLPLTEEQIAEMQAAAEKERAENAAVLKELMDE